MKKSVDYILLNIAIGLFAGVCGLEIISDVATLNADMSQLYPVQIQYFKTIATGGLIVGILALVLLFAGSICLTKKLKKVKLGVCLTGVALSTYPIGIGVISIIATKILADAMNESGQQVNLGITVFLYALFLVGGFLMLLGSLPPMQDNKANKGLNLAGCLITLIAYSIVLALGGVGTSFVAVLSILAFIGAFIIYIVFSFKYDEATLLASLLGVPAGPQKSAYAKPSFMQDPIENNEQKTEGTSDKANEDSSNDSYDIFGGDNR